MGKSVNLGVLSRVVKQAQNMMTLSFFAGATSYALFVVLVGQSGSDLWPGILALVVYLGFTAGFAALAVSYGREAKSAAEDILGLDSLNLFSPLDVGLSLLSFAFAMGFAFWQWSKSYPLPALADLVGMVVLCALALRVARKAKNRTIKMCPNCGGELEPYWIACPFCRTAFDERRAKSVFTGASRL